MTSEFSVTTRQRSQMVDITAQVQAEVTRQNCQQGLVTVFVPHTTAAVTINEGADPDVCSDILGGLAGLVPLRSPDYRHSEGNSDAHIKATLVGASVQVPVVGGRLKLGTWQRVFLCEFDGPRSRTVLVHVGS